MGKDSLVYNNFMGRLFSFSDCINRENYGSLVEWIGMIGKNLLESFGDSCDFSLLFTASVINSAENILLSQFFTAMWEKILALGRFKLNFA